MKIELPSKPTDQYEVEWYAVEYVDYIRRYRAVYHVSTPWNEYRPDSPNRGADLCDDWMIHSSYVVSECDQTIKDEKPMCCDGRRPGWGSLGKEQDNTFLTLDEAKSALASNLRQLIEHEEQRTQRRRDLLAVVEE